MAHLLKPDHSHVLPFSQVNSLLISERHKKSYPSKAYYASIKMANTTIYLLETPTSFSLHNPILLCTLHSFNFLMRPKYRYYQNLPE